MEQQQRLTTTPQRRRIEKPELSLLKVPEPYSVKARTQTRIEDYYA